MMLFPVLFPRQEEVSLFKLFLISLLWFLELLYIIKSHFVELQYLTTLRRVKNVVGAGVSLV